MTNTYVLIKKLWGSCTPPLINTSDPVMNPEGSQLDINFCKKKIEKKKFSNRIFITNNSI